MAHPPRRSGPEPKVEMTTRGTVRLVLPDQRSGQVMSVEMDPAVARDLGEQLFKAGVNAGRAPFPPAA